jgi:hypothetical protein
LHRLAKRPSGYPWIGLGSKPQTVDLVGGAPSRPKGTLREHRRGHARPRAATPLPLISSPCGVFVPAASRACPRVPPRRSMVRRGSTVRVRQRASGKALQSATFRLPKQKRRARAGTRGLLLAFPRRPRDRAEFGLFKGIGRASGHLLHREGVDGSSPSEGSRESPRRRASSSRRRSPRPPARSRLP